MFANRYFALRYFTNRYFNKGFTAAEFPISVDAVFEFGASISKVVVKRISTGIDFSLVFQPKVIGKNVLATIEYLTSIKRDIARTIPIDFTFTTTVEAVRFYMKLIFTDISFGTSISKSVTKTILAPIEIGLVINKVVSKTVATGIVFSTIVGKLFTVLIEVGLTLTATVSISSVVVIEAVIKFTSSVAKSIPKTILAGLTFALGSILKSPFPPRDWTTSGDSTKNWTDSSASPKDWTTSNGKEDEWE